MVVEASDIMKKAGMSFSKWRSNSEVVSEMLSTEFRNKSLDDSSLKVLGLQWIAIRDNFSFALTMRSIANVLLV